MSRTLVCLHLRCVQADLSAKSVCMLTSIADPPRIPLQGANKKSWFLYPQTKGEVEENVKNLQFARTSIFRPGLLNRGELARTVESVGLYLMPNVCSPSSTPRGNRSLELTVRACPSRSRCELSRRAWWSTSRAVQRASRSGTTPTSRSSRRKRLTLQSRRRCERPCRS
jgi:hypothetical protein